MNVLYVYGDKEKEWNCSEWNCAIPARAIDKIEGHTATLLNIEDFTKNTEESQKLCSEADIIVIERNYFGTTVAMIQFWKGRNKTIIGIFDDAYDLISVSNPAYVLWKEGKINIVDDKGNNKEGQILPLPLEQFKWALQIVKAIQVPSVNLAKDWWIYNDTHFVHNYLELDKYKPVEPLLPYDGITIGWCGSTSHRESFMHSGVFDALRKVAKRNPNVRVLIGGDKAIYNTLKVENKIFQEHVPAEQWTALLSSLDIGLAPLFGEFDKRRSWIKVLEYLALKIPWIATNYITYDEFKNLGVMVENGYVNWEKAIEEMIKEYPVYKELANTKGYEFALTQSSDENVRKVTLPLYKKLINSPYPLHLRERKDDTILDKEEEV